MAELRCQQYDSQVGSIVYDSSDAPVLDSLTNNTYIEKYELTVEQKKIKVGNIYSSSRWRDECQYEIMKIQKVIRNHIFKNLKCCKRGGTK